MKRVVSILVLLMLGTLLRAQPHYEFRMLDASCGLPENNVREVLMLPDGLMCIQTSSYLCLYDGASCRNYRWDPVEVPYAEYSGQDQLSYDAESERILLRSRDHYWAFDRREHVFLYNLPLPSSENGKPADNLFPTAVSSRSETAVTSDGQRWFMSDKRIVHYDPKTGQLSETEVIPAGNDDLFTSIAVDGEDNLWVGTARSGVRIVYQDGTSYRFPRLDRIDGKPVYPHSDISKIYADPQGGVWIATQQEGLLYWHKDIIRIRTVNAASLREGSMPDESVKCLAEGPDGKVLIGTVHGLLRYDPHQQSMDIPYRELADELIISLYVDSRSRIWAGTFYNGLYCVDQGKVRHFSYPQQSNVDVSYQHGTPNLNCVRALKEDPDGNYWISVYGGVGRFDPETGEIRLLRDSHPELGRYMLVRDLYLKADGSFVAAGDNGRFRYDPATDRVDRMDTVDAYSLTNQILEDAAGRIWLAESGGLSLRDPMQGDRAVTESGVVMALAEDGMGGLWASSTSGISRIVLSPDGSLFRTDYGQSDGVDCGAFFQHSVLRHSDGQLYFGGSSGFCIVDPTAMAPSDYGIPPMLTSFRVGGEERPAKDVTLAYNETSLEFAFSNLNYANPTHTTYRYMLDGFDRQWHTVTSVPFGTAGYTYLEPGKYVFRVQATNNGTDWSQETTVPIEIKPPFWRTRWAYAFYLLLLLGLITGIVLFFFRKERRHMSERAAEERRKQEEELNQMKFRFFTNISHELRTPLSLIILPLESLMKEKEGTSEYAKLDTMHRSAKSLLDLVNHLLDFRKVETGGERLNLRKGNFSDFVVALVESFRDTAERKDIRLTLADSSSNPMMAFDSTMMQKVVNNLLSNALKFTPAGGSVEVRLSDTDGRQMQLEVADTGIGIPPSDLHQVFDRFYRSGNTGDAVGSGIGLSLVRQYVEMHRGRVFVVSDVGNGSTFTVQLPMDLEETASVQPLTDDSPLEQEENEHPVGTDRKRIMVVDDNADFRLYLCDELSQDYLVSDAADGEECLDKLPSVRPDIVVTDVMMPKMNGFELTRRIKENVETSHIAVILLSARMSEDIRTEGYECGADSYLTKPFKMDMLQIRIKNLLEEREKRIRSFSGSAEVSPMHVTVTTVDQKLMTRIMEKLEANMDNTEYSVEELAADVGMHRMNLYRKIQSLYGMTPSEFIRTMRLKRAAQLLGDDPNLTVSEVADRVGFNTPKYFTRYFKEMFGVLPSQYRK